MQNSFSASFDIKKVAAGMMAAVDAIHNHPKEVRGAIIACLFNSWYKSINTNHTVSDIMMIIDRVRMECKRNKVPEFGGAEQYIKKELN